MKNINYLYPIPNNLDHFTHPNLNQKFKYANSKEIIAIANEVLTQIINSGYKTVIYSESGTSPLIHICKKLCNKKKIKINFIPFKTPRSANINLYEMIMYYLTDIEKEELINKEKRKNILYRLCNINISIYFADDFSIYDVLKKNVDNEFLKKIRDILRDTYISKVFRNKFLFFDEYINAGTILRNFKFYANLFGANNNYKIASYCMFITNPEDYEMIEFTIYNKTTELECYERGAYPFENRIDIIGYYYFIDKNNYQKIYLKKLVNEFTRCDGNKLESYIESIINKINSNKLLDKMQRFCREEQIKSYINNYDIIRYLFKSMEEDIGKTKYSEYLDQVYELYAPAWSPMPVIFHLDYWQVFSKIETEINNLKELFKKEYIENRNSIFIESLKVLKKIRKEYLKEIDRLMEDL